MRIMLAMALTMGIAQPAWSLSCLRPDVARDYAFAAASEDRYTIAKGRLSFDATRLPKQAADLHQKPPKQTDITAWFDGQSLTPDGFTRRFERDVVLRVECLGPWCGNTEEGTHLAFLKQDGTQFIMTLSPCGGMTYFNPTAEQEETALACMNGERCSSDEKIKQ